MEFENLRKKYPFFIFHNYDIQENNEEFKVVFHFEILGLEHFEPTYTLKKKDINIYKDLKVVKQACFGLGMVELISYWKITCSPNVIIECGSLDEFQINWFKKLYYKGLGEFFYTNNIICNIDDFMNIKAYGNDIEGDDYPYEVDGNLICVGGGKDSFVSLDLLKDEFDHNDAYVINKVQSAIHSAIAAGYANKLINPSRSLDSRMLELNKQGFLNGHTPFSAMVAFASYLTALIYHKKYIVLSNEASANESTVKDMDVNHQYSKSYEFECDFKEYTARYLDDKILYFSLLRCLSEMQITKLFSQLEAYHSVFKSCNVGSKKEIWCNHCAKCLFVYIMLSAHLDDDKLDNIFHDNLLENEELLDIFDELCGINDNKPFECVGTRDEVNTAICLAIKRRDHIPYLYRHYMDSKYYEYYKDRNDYEHFYNHDHMIPSHFENYIKERKIY